MTPEDLGVLKAVLYLAAFRMKGLSLSQRGYWRKMIAKGQVVLAKLADQVEHPQAKAET